MRSEDVRRLMAASTGHDREVERKLATHRERLPRIGPGLDDGIPVLSLELAPVVDIKVARRRRDARRRYVSTMPYGGAA